MLTEAKIRAQYEVMTNGTDFGVRRRHQWGPFRFYVKYGEVGYYRFHTRAEAEANIEEAVAYRLGRGTCWRPADTA